jgi:hypothetical protein
MVTRFKDGTFVYPAALLRVTREELEEAAKARHAGAGRVNSLTDDDDNGGDLDDEETSANPEIGGEDDEREAA